MNPPMFSRDDSHEAIRLAAEHVSDVLHDHGYSIHVFEPNDGTRYEVLCALNGLNRLVYVGLTNFVSVGNGIYGYSLDSFTVPEYFMEKSGMKSLGSARVMCDFINCLKDNLRKA